MPARILQFPLARPVAKPRGASRRPHASGVSSDPKLARGLFRAPYSVDGVEILLAVDSRGSRVVEIPLRSGVDGIAVFDAIEQLLDLVDPLPASTHLELLP